MKLIITKTEFAGDKNHYVYLETPDIVKSKIKKFIAANSKPSISVEDEEKYGRFIYQADVMLYPTIETESIAKEIYNELTSAIAILAFVPGGIEIFGYRYEVDGSS